MTESEKILKLTKQLWNRLALARSSENIASSWMQFLCSQFPVKDGEVILLQSQERGLRIATHSSGNLDEIINDFSFLKKKYTYVKYLDTAGQPICIVACNFGKAFDHKDYFLSYCEEILAATLINSRNWETHLHKTLNTTMSSELSKMKKLNEELHEALAVKTKFLANVSHELRTPLNAVIGMSELLLDNTKKEEDQKKLRSIIDAGDALTELINDILDLSKIQSASFKIESVSFDLKELIDDCIDSLRPLCHDKLSLNHNCEIKGKALRKGDPKRIKQILTHLITNAIKFTQEGDISLQVEEERDGHMLFCIADTGIGIDDQKKNDIFKEFMQGDDSTTREFGGTGLGLTICNELVMAMNGKIWVEDNVNANGSCFFFEIPLPLLDGKETTPVIKVNDVDSHASKLSVLIVDDSKINLSIASNYLEKLGIAATTVSSGKECIDLYAQTNFDFVLLDIRMPVMDGIEVVYYIREIEKTQARKPCYCAAVTADVVAHSENELKKFGFDELIAKPLRKNDLSRICAQVELQIEG